MVEESRSDLDNSTTEDDCTLFVTNLPPQTTEELLFELFLQVGPVDHVCMKADSNYAFINFEDSESVPYAIAMLSGITLFGQPISLSPKNGSVHNSRPNVYLEALRSFRDRVMSGNGDRAMYDFGHSIGQPALNGMDIGPSGGGARWTSFNRERSNRASWPYCNGFPNNLSPNDREMNYPRASGYLSMPPRWSTAHADRSFYGSSNAGTSGHSSRRNDEPASYHSLNTEGRRNRKRRK
uniref:RRM domain-containing protein n=1 Tax=Trichuris muris TaxID=70415 RepID=A0A5S6R4U9_TRIMR